MGFFFPEFDQDRWLVEEAPRFLSERLVFDSDHYVHSLHKEQLNDTKQSSAGKSGF